MTKEDKKEKVRLNFGVSPAVDDSLKGLAKKQGKTKTAIVLSALAVYTRIVGAGNNGSKVILREKNGEECEIVFL